jgi:signal transduction histidine kinase
MDFVAGVSHELRTPLTVICAAADNLAEGVILDSSPQVRQYGEVIREEGRKLGGMVEQVLQYASIRSGRRQYNPEPALVADLVEDAIARAMPAIQAAGFDLEKEIDPTPYTVNVDAAALAQSLRNLINNALKYSGDSRFLAVRTSSAPGKEGQEVLISVEDRGIGIEPGDLPNIFEPFYRGRPAIAAQIHGSGLGLSMAREAVLAMGGDITVRSVPGKGSVFTIHLPALRLSDAAPPTDPRTPA